jgi:hypothetical protein
MIFAILPNVTGNPLGPLDDVVTIPWVIALFYADRAQGAILETVNNNALTTGSRRVAGVGEAARTVEGVGRPGPAVA